MDLGPDISPDSPNSNDNESIQSDGAPTQYSSEVPTEPLNASERRHVDIYMTHRQQFMSDFERYNPVQNLSVLASHVFDVSHNLQRVTNDIDGSRRLINIVSDNQRQENEAIRDIGEDVSSLKDNVFELKREVGQFHQEIRETQEGIKELKNMIAMLMGGVRA